MLESDIARIKDEATQPLPVDIETEWEGHILVDGRRLLPRGSALVSLGSPMPHLREDFPVILGDAIGNYRAALDHLTWALVKRFKAPLTVKQARAVQFPMHNSAGDFEAQKARRTPGLPDTPHRAIMKGYQPYRRGYGPRGIRWIRSLADVDKHRAVPVTVLAPHGISYTYSVNPGIGIIRVEHLSKGPVPLDPGTPIDKVILVREPNVRECVVEV